jgi:hypothetical protein
MGAAHRLVEDARAGWVVQWRDIATDHRASEGPVGEQLSTSTNVSAEAPALVEASGPATLSGDRTAGG